jgi:hypothetical protein
MTRNKMLIISLIIALIFDFPFRWIRYKGDQMVSIFDVYNLGVKYMSFDLSTLFVSTLIIFIFWNGIRNFNTNKHDNS